MDDSQKNRCPKCGGVLGGTASGSITQWVTSCTCGTADTAVDAPVPSDAAVMEICSTCKRRINRGRQGSFTQWVFRSDICDCDTPQPMLVSTEEQRSDLHQSNYEPHEEPLEAVIDVDPTRFPLQRYSPLTILGTGAVGTVYLCHDRLLSKRVAIKTLSHLTDNDLVAFQREAKATSKLNHPNIVQILDFGATESGMPFMVLEFVEGTDLATIVENTGALDVETTLIIFGQVCDGLQEAHQNGIFHRDVKGSNILVSGLEQPNDAQREPENLDIRIIDFGVAGFVAADDVTVQGTTIVGTPSFMAPDLAAGRPYDAKSEIYSVGCTIFNALTGRTVFQADTALEILNLHASQPAPKLSESRPDLEFPPQLETIVQKCLEKNPDARYESIEELGNAIKSLLNAMDIGAADRTDGTVTSDDIALFAGERDAMPGSKPLQGTVLEKSDTKATAIKLFTWIAALAVVGVAGMAGYNQFIARHDASSAPDPVSSTAEKFDAFASLPDDAEEKTSGKLKQLDLNGVPYLVSGLETLTDADFKEAARIPNVAGVYIIGSHPVSSGLSLGGEGLACFADYPLKYLKIEGTSLSSEAFTAIAKIKSLKHIYLGNIKITDEDLSKLSSLPALKELDLANSKISLDAIAGLSKFPSLQSVSLVGMRNLTPESVSTLSTARNLRDLDISCTTLGAQNLTPLKTLKNLDELTFNQSGVSDNSLAVLALVPVQTLNLENNPITGSGLKSLAGNKTLTVISLRNCRSLVRSLAQDLREKMPNCKINY